MTKGNNPGKDCKNSYVTLQWIYCNDFVAMASLQCFCYNSFVAMAFAFTVPFPVFTNKPTMFPAKSCNGFVAMAFSVLPFAYVYKRTYHLS